MTFCIMIICSSSTYVHSEFNCNYFTYRTLAWRRPVSQGVPKPSTIVRLG